VNNSTLSLETIGGSLACADSKAWTSITANLAFFVASYFYSIFKAPENRTPFHSWNNGSLRLTSSFATFSPDIANFAFGE
jgi:hypothetical protein